jgi:hypothetical protein
MFLQSEDGPMSARLRFHGMALMPTLAYEDCIELEAINLICIPLRICLNSQ